VDGRAQFVGSDGNAVRKAIERAIASPHGLVRIAFDSGDANRLRQGSGGPPKRSAEAESVALQVSVRDLPSVGRADRADIIVAITEDRLRSNVTRGENHGRTLTHAAVVRSMTTIGEASAGGSASGRADIAIAPDWQREQLKVVAFVQERRGRAILASASAPLQNARR